MKETVTFEDVHRAGVSGYKIDIKRRPGVDATLCPNEPGTFEITVETVGWRIATTGGFTLDELTDPVFFLEPGVENPDDPEPMQRQGFFVRENEDAEDDYTLGAAAMIHLYNNNPASWTTRKGGVSWAPISLGLGVSEGSDLRYYLGTSLKFGDAMFLTAGGVFGPRKRLPDALDSNEFTTEANALGTLGSRTDEALFVSFSYKFLDRGVTPFGNALDAKLPKDPKLAADDGGRTGATEAEDSQQEAPEITSAIWDESAKTLTLTGKDFGDGPKVFWRSEDGAQDQEIEVSSGGETIVAKFPEEQGTPGETLGQVQVRVGATAESNWVDVTSSKEPDVPPEPETPDDHEEPVPAEGLADQERPNDRRAR